MQKFLEVIPPGTKFDFIERRWRWISLSIIAVLLSVGVMGWRWASTGAPLNWGIDFSGGSQVQMALSPESPPSIDELRAALDELGYEGGSVVEVPDKDNEILIRVKEVLAIDEATLAACEAAVQTVGPASLVELSHPDQASKLFLAFDVEPNYREVERRLSEAGCDGKADKGAVAREGTASVEVALVGIGASMRDQLDERFGDGTVDHIVRAETVGSKVGDQLKSDGVTAMLFAIGFIFLYVMIRFDLRFAPGGIIALMHDAIIVVGAFAVTGKEFSLTTIAALLTIIGYSINDTIVVFDRIRERVALYRDEPIQATTNAALNDTLSRTILTSATTIVVVIATYIMGTGAIADFSFALIVGLVVGTYSSLFVATPVFLWVNDRFYQGRDHLRWRAGGEGPGTGTLLGGDKAAGDAAITEADIEAAAADAEPSEADAAAPDEAPRTATRRRRRRRPGADDGPKPDDAS